MKNYKELNMDMSGFGVMIKANVMKDQLFKQVFLILILAFWSSISLASEPAKPSSVSINKEISHAYHWVVSWKRPTTGRAPTKYELQESYNGGAYKTVYDGPSLGRTISKPHPNSPEGLNYMTYHYGYGSYIDEINGVYRYRVQSCVGSNNCSGYAPAVAVTFDYWESEFTFSLASDVYTNTHYLDATSGYNNHKNPVMPLKPAGIIRHELNITAIRRVDLSTGESLEIPVVKGRTNLRASNPRVEAINDLRFRITENGPGKYSYSLKGKLVHIHRENNWRPFDNLKSYPKTVNIHAPEVPTGFNVPASASSEFSVSWNESSFPTPVTYELQEEKIGGTSPFGLTTIYKGADLNYNRVHSDGESFIYRVRACQPAGCSEWSEHKSTQFIERPLTPVKIQLISGDDIGLFSYNVLEKKEHSAGRFRLFFGAPENIADADVSSYRIRVSKNNGPFKNLEEVSNRLLPFEFGLGYYRQYNFNKGVYRFQIQACNSACGCGEFASAGNAVEVLGVPSKVNQPSVPKESDGNIELDWEPPTTAAGSAATYYEIYQSPSLLMSTKSGQQSAYFVLNSDTSISMNREPGEYKYQVRGCNLAGCGAWSEFSQDVTVLPPGTPEKFTIDSSHQLDDVRVGENDVISNFADDNGDYLIKWESYESKVLDITYFLTETSSQSKPIEHVLTKSSFSVTGKEQGNYGYQLKACIPNPDPLIEEMRCGDPTRQLNIEVARTPDSPLLKLIEAPNSDGSTESSSTVRSSIDLEWDPTENATYYQVQQTVAGETKMLADQSGVTSRSINLELVGTYSYSYKVRACNGNTNFELCSEFSNIITVEATPEYSIDQAPLPQVGSSSAQPDDSDRVGSLSGSFRVNESGAATYQVSIDTAPGTAGVTPKMGLYYSSQGGNGLMGQGWNITGTSNISRCRSTLGQDRKALPITWSESDRFCLDGQRLLAIQGGIYGANNTLYKTEIDTFVTVKSVGGQTGSPDYFEVTRKDGSTSYYGKAINSDGSISNAKLTLGSNVLSWGMNEFADNVGNQVTFKYENEDGYQYLNEVGYAYGDGSTPRAKIKYHYASNRPDPMTVYTSGESQLMTKRLSKIESENEGILLRQYNFDYEVTNQLNAPSRLMSIEMCTQGNVCLPETRFDWTTALEGSFPSSPSDSAYIINATRASNSHLTDSKFADINGDGYTDIIYTTTIVKVKKRFFGKPKVRIDQRLHYLINSGDGRFAIGESFSYQQNDNNVEEAVPLILETLDYNGDGRTDVLVKSELAENSADRRWHLYLSTATGSEHWELQRESERFPFTGDDIGFADLNSDGLVDVFDGTRFWLLKDSGNPDSSRFPYRYSGTGQEISYKDGFDWDSRYVADDPSTWGNTKYYSGEDAGVKSGAGDVNGDGVSDFLVQSFGYQIALSVVQGDELVTFVPANNAPRISDHSVTQFADFNNDGLSDIIYWHKIDNSARPTRGWRVQLSTGTGFTDPIELNDIALNYHDFNEEEDGPADAAEENRVQAVDVNNDGYADVVWQTSSQIRVRHWNQKTQSFNNSISLRSLTVDDRDNAQIQHIFADFNGDAVNDYVRFQGSGGLPTYHFHHASGDSSNPAANNIGNVIHRFTNGLGAQTNMHYERLSLTDAYMKLEPGINSVGCRVFFNLACDSDYNNDYTAFNVPFGDLSNESISLQKEEPLTRVFVSNSPIPLVTEVSSSAPTMENPAGMSSLEYGYGHAKVQMGGRGNLGFKYLSTRDTQTGVVTTNTYRQDWPFIGYPLSSRVETADNNLLSESFSKWTIYGIEDSADRKLDQMISDAQSNGTADLGSMHIYVKESVEKAYELKENGADQGILMSKKVTQTEQDEYGNTTMLRVKNFEDDSDNPIQEAETANTYGTSANDIYGKTMGRLSHTLATTGRPRIEKNSENTRARESQYQYYTTGALRGLLSKEVIEPNGGQALKLEIEHEYDAFGNRIHSKSKGWDGQAVVTRFGAKEEYGPYGRYMNGTYQIYPGKGEVRTSQVLSRNEYGSPTETVDVNGVHAYTKYSKMGVQYFSTTDIGGWSETYLSADTIGNYCPSYASYVQITKGADGSESRECLDMLARSIRTLARNFDGGWVATDVRYDNIGRTIHQSEPYATTGGDQTGALYTTIDYDITGRQIYSILADGSDVQVTYDGYRKTESNDLRVGSFGYEKTEIINSLGEIVEVIDDDGANIRYYHNEGGELVKMIDVAGNETTIDYDRLNRKIGMTDPDKGAWTYKYNAFGELVMQTDAKGQIVTTQYDALGRQTKRIDYRTGGAKPANIENTVSWLYDNKENGIGQISSVEDSSSYSMSYEYDRFGRNFKSYMTVPGLSGQVFESWQTYDELGRAFQAFDASSNQEGNGARGVETVYNQYGFVSESRDVRTYPGTDTPVRFYNRTLAVDVRGNVTEYVLGNGVVVTKRYNEATGRLETVKSTEPFSNHLIQDLQYSWDTIGNLTYRYDYSGSKKLQESFEYDNLNRLRLSHTSDLNKGETTNQTLEYDLMGNIKNKSDVGDYVYGLSNKKGDDDAGPGPHAVISAGGESYEYDDNGNNTVGDGRTLSYSTFDKVVDVSRGDHRTTFNYGPDRSRYKREDYENNNLSKTTYYLGNVEYIEYANGEREYKRQLGMVLETLYYNGSDYDREERHYLLQDHLGSTDLIVGEDPFTHDGDVQRITILEELSFDAWGQRRDPSTWGGFTQAQLEGYDTKYTTRGFTGHEMVDGVGIIHMNGRIYDAKLARFLQADPIIQEPYYTQSLNRYSYVWNNPLNATDPSGYEALTFLALVVLSAKAAAVTFAVTTVFALAQGASLGQALGAGFEAGLNAFATTFVTAGLFGPGFTDFFDTNLFTEAIGSGIQGGITSVIQGGKFGDGFVSSALSTGIGGSKLFAGTAENGAATGGLLGSAGLGPDVSDILLAGTVSELTGGKFVNGAISAASSIANREVSGALFSKGIKSIDRKNQSDTYSANEVGGTWDLWKGCNQNGNATACANLLITNSNDLKDALNFIEKDSPELLENTSRDDLDISFFGHPSFVFGKGGTTDVETGSILLNRAYVSKEYFVASVAHELGHRVSGEFVMTVSGIQDIFFPNSNGYGSIHQGVEDRSVKLGKRYTESLKK